MRRRGRINLEEQKKKLELGKIRFGIKANNGKEGKDRREYPKAIDTWRFTSSHREILEQVAEVYGGTVKPWEGRPGQFDLVTTSNELRVVLRPDAAASEMFEQWTGGGCTHRCDGVNCEWYEKIVPAPTDPKQPKYHPKKEVPCLCEPDARECKRKTRFSLMLSVPMVLGAWRLDSSSWNFNGETFSTLDDLTALGVGDRPFFGLLRLEHRDSSNPAENKKFIVPVLVPDPSPPQVAKSLAAVSDRALELPAPAKALPQAERTWPEVDEGERRDAAENMTRLGLASDKAGVQRFKDVVYPSGRHWAVVFNEGALQGLKTWQEFCDFAVVPEKVENVEVMD